MSLCLLQILKPRGGVCKPCDSSDQWRHGGGIRKLHFQQFPFYTFGFLFNKLTWFQMKSLSSQAGRLNMGKLPRFLESGTDEDDWREAVEKMCTAAEILA